MFAGQLLWVSSNTFVRVSVLLLYISLFPSRMFRILTWTLFGINVAFGLSVIIQTLLICHPVAFNWDVTIKGGTCANQKLADLTIGIVNILLDVCTVALPMPTLWGLHLTTKKKVMLCGIFSLGIMYILLPLILDIVRLTLSQHLHHYDTTGPFDQRHRLCRHHEELCRCWRLGRS